MVNADRKRRPIVTDQSQAERPAGVTVEQWDRQLARSNTKMTVQMGARKMRAVRFKGTREQYNRTRKRAAALLKRKSEPPSAPPAERFRVRHVERGITVLDVDPRTCGEDSLEEVSKQRGANFPFAWELVTADGSRHLYKTFRGGNVDHRTGLEDFTAEEEPRPMPELLLKLGVTTAFQYQIAAGLWVHESGEPEDWQLYQMTRSTSLAWSSPHEMPASAGNFELMAMNVIHFHTSMRRAWDALAVTREDWTKLGDHMSAECLRVSTTVDNFWSQSAVNEAKEKIGVEQFLPRWHAAGFPRLEVGHKLAAALCCTDVPPEIEVRAPWDAWSLVVPDGLFPQWGVARLWCIGTEWTTAVGKGGAAMRAPEPGQRIDPVDQGIVSMIRNLIRGACLSIANPDEHRKKGAHGGASSSKNHRHGPPDLAQARFLLAAPVAIDLREHVAGVSSGRVSKAPKVQFLVRGHWREQVHGAARSLRKRIWIQPFWKGPEGARVLLRSHTLKDDETP